MGEPIPVPPNSTVATLVLGKIAGYSEWEAEVDLRFVRRAVGWVMKEVLQQRFTKELPSFAAHSKASVFGSSPSASSNASPRGASHDK